MLVFQGFLLSAITCLGVTCHCQSLYESALPHEPVVFPWESIVYICFDSLIKYHRGLGGPRRLGPPYAFCVSVVSCSVSRPTASRSRSASRRMFWSLKRSRCSPGMTWVSIPPVTCSRQPSKGSSKTVAAQFGPTSALNRTSFPANFCRG